ncbi:sensory transduction histidine kinase [alpha proteobacterium U9-1i]|nr:sensory transduction histidine kinase [alpha proteobacterium U9-1i]
MAALLGLAFLPAGVIAMQAGLSAVSERQAGFQQSVGAQEALVVGELREELIQLREMARTLAANASLFVDDARVCNDTLVDLGERFPNIANIVVIDASARVRCANHAAAVGQHIESPLVETATSAGRSAVGFVRSPVLSAMPVFAAVAPTSVGPRSWNVGVSRAAQPLMERVAQVSSQRDTYSILVDGQGQVLVRFGMPLSRGDERELTEFLREGATTWSGGAFAIGSSWAVIAPVQENALYLLRGWRPAPLTWSERGEIALALALPLLLWLIAVAAAWWAVEVYVARPLSVLEDLARAYARGQTTYGEEMLLRGAPMELASLRRTMAAMAKTLSGRELRLAEALREERTLLREVHHRVKNNLQMMASILSIQSRSAEDEAEARGLARANERVHVLAIAHTHIYASGEVHEIALDELAAEIARTLVGSRGSDVRLKSELEPVRAEVDEAVAFAFLIGEAVCIALDATPAGKGAIINLALKGVSEGAIFLGVTSPDADTVAPTASSALRLIQAFARQLNANVTSCQATPTLIEITIPPAAAPAPAPAPAEA